MKRQWYRKLISGLMALGLAISLTMPALAEEGHVVIRTEEDLEQLAWNCSSDAYSNGLRVILASDLDLSDREITIPVFLGAFDGMGHHITGLELEENASSYGLFNRVESGAVIKNLWVEGEIAPSGTQSKVGGIVGENYGTIEQCTFSGIVIGSSSVGGISGYNGGTISDSQSFGAIRGTTYVGGIAGHNEGTLTRCGNQAAVNTTVSEEELQEMDLEEFENTIYSMLKQEDVTENSVVTDAGGIAGWSTGEILNCTNNGGVGYPHIGYNVGGIVGRQNGYLSGNINRGKIQGRKDVGGIVGQMSPEITLNRSEDRLDEIETELDTLNDQIDHLLDDVEQTSDNISERMDRVSECAERAGDQMHSLTNQLQDFADDNISALNLMLSTVERYIAKLTPIMDDLDEAADSMKVALELLQDFSSLDDLDELKGSLAEMKNAVISFANAVERSGQWLKKLSEEDLEHFSELGSEFRDTSDSLHVSLVSLSRELSTLSDEVQEAGSKLNEDLRQINDCMNRISNLTTDLLHEIQDFDENDIFEDVSEESLQSATRGIALTCTNYGAVCADRNAGGIAGAMAIEYDLDPEDDLHRSERHSLRSNYQTKAILMECNNYGSVQAKKSCAGGVTGRMDLGTIDRCGGWGDVSSENGDYVGGVAGLSLSSIRESYAKCTLSGKKYVGGIAGSGNRISDCIAMVAVSECEQFGGAIAGEITDEYNGNRFVSDTLAGVDRISLSGKAEKLDYDTLCAMDAVPNDFKQMTLRFVADEKTWKKLSFSYGDSFGADSYPTVPEKEDHYVRWDRTNLENLRFDTVATAIYEPFVTTLASDEMRENKAVCLVEGHFRQGDTLILASGSNADAEAEISETVLECWSLEIPADGKESHRVRLLLPSDLRRTPTVYTKDELGWKQTESEIIGSYLCFDLEGNGMVALTISGLSPVVFAVTLVTCLGIGLTVFARVHIMKKNRSIGRRS